MWTKGVACAGYRLPTEAEWEWAARGGTTNGELGKVAWYADNSDGRPHPVGQKTANAYGLYDMLGSQWEWTWDVEQFGGLGGRKLFTGPMSDPIPSGLTETKGTSNSRMVRGGSFRSYENYVRAGHRYQYPVDSGSVDYGFRPVRTVVAKAK